MATLTITKEEFEAHLCVAISPNSEVYEKVQPHFETYFEECRHDVLGTKGTEAVDNNTIPLCNVVKAWVCFRAFLGVFRQLDLVLTPTGFGVVSTNQMAPASKQRVDALIGQLRDNALSIHGRLLEELCKVSDWGHSDQARENIDTLFYDFRMLRKMQGPATSHLEWQTAQRLIGEADEALRLKISNQYMDHLLDAVRCNNASADDKPIIFQCRHIINLWVCGDQEAVKLRMRRLLSKLDADWEKYSVYREFGYPVNHYETFENTKNSPAFVFGGRKH